MDIDKKRFCINRKIAPSLSLEEFFKTVKKCGLSRVELRNDMPSGNILDDLTISQFNELKEEYGIDVVTINALYPFNLPSARDEVTKKAEDMLSIAKQIKCQAIILCPYNEADVRKEEQREKDTLDSIAYFSELFNKNVIQGLVEPLGFSISSLRSYIKAGELIRKANSSFQLVLDTFHHHLAELSIEDYRSTVDVSQIGLVHLSGVEDDRPTEKLTDEERIMLSKKDVLKSKEQVVQLEALGYTGLYSFEPFSSTLHQWRATDVENAITSSIQYICS